MYKVVAVRSSIGSVEESTSISTILVLKKSKPEERNNLLLYFSIFDQLIALRIIFLNCFVKHLWQNSKTADICLHLPPKPAGYEHLNLSM